jgi:signal recognition particle subunit SEC65
VGQALRLGRAEVQAVERVFEPPAMQVPVEAFFGDALRLLGYGVQQEAGELGVTLHWQAVRRMDVAYKFFVHLLDPETGELVAQADVMPRDWTYPTHWWEAGEVVSDEIRLGLSKVSPGAYDVAIGAYDPETGVRLVVTESADGGEPSDQYLLPERVDLP